MTTSRPLRGARLVFSTPVHPRLTDEVKMPDLALTSPESASYRGSLIKGVRMIRESGNRPNWEVRGFGWFWHMVNVPKFSDPTHG